jgi:hypothetical protein
LLSFILGFLGAVLLVPVLNTWHGNGSYEHGFTTEIGMSSSTVNEALKLILIDVASLRPAIDLVRLRFSGTLRYKDGDHLYIDLGPEDVRYFGSPSLELDDVWEELIGDHEGAFSEDILG